MRRFMPILLALLALLAVAALLTWRLWVSLDGSAMNGNGVAALIIGAVGSLVLGGGLMILVFYSSRRGYDDRVEDASAARAPADPAGRDRVRRGAADRPPG
jgi:hypothetical protein